MRVSIILAHPAETSFNHAIARRVQSVASEHGHLVAFHDLYQEGFDPVMPAAEIDKNASLPSFVARHCDEICEAEGIVVVHPNWWSQPPAILRGWMDRVLRPGRAYNFVPDGKGGGKPVGLLKARFALVLNTANTPQEKEELFFGDPLEVFWKKVVFGLCGVTQVTRRNFSPVIVSSEEQRKAWLEEVEGLARGCFSLVAADNGLR
jgi:NAD(P)H dehydrogenase (quinone)